MTKLTGLRIGDHLIGTSYASQRTLSALFTVLAITPDEDVLHVEIRTDPINVMPLTTALVWRAESYHDVVAERDLTLLVNPHNLELRAVEDSGRLPLSPFLRFDGQERVALLDFLAMPVER